MKNRIVEIATDGVHISASRGFIKITKDGQKLGQVAIEDATALIIRGYGSTLSANICARMANANIPVVICGPSQSPDSVLWPLSGHHAQGRIMAAQSGLTRPRRKRLWQDLVRAKISAQGHVLQLAGQNSRDVFSMAMRVKSGDPDNLEAQAARRYWPRIMGDDFTRDQSASKSATQRNAALNYGYTVLRAACARSIVAAGLHPSLSVHHESRGQALRLADDFMEPFRPWVDLTVRKNIEMITDADSLIPDLKGKLVAVLSLDLQTEYGNSPLQLCLDRLAQSLANIVTGERKTLDLPGPPAAPQGDLPALTQRKSAAACAP